MSDRPFIVKSGKTFRAAQPRISKKEGAQLGEKLDGALRREDADRPGRRYKFGWVQDPALPYWRIEARGVLAKNGDEVIRRFWIRKGNRGIANQVVVGPGSWDDSSYEVSGVTLPKDVDVSTWNIDDIISYIDKLFPLKKTRSDIDRITAYQEAYRIVRRPRIKTGVHYALIHLYFGWREAWIQLGRDPQNFDDFAACCGFHPDIMFRMLAGRSKRKQYTLAFLTKCSMHLCWYMTRYDGPICVLEFRPDFIILPVWIWPDPDMDETTKDVIHGARMRHQITHDQGGFVRMPRRYVSYWSAGKRGAAQNRDSGMEADLRPEVTWQTLTSGSGEVDFIQLKPEIRVQGYVREPTEWEEIAPENFHEAIKVIIEKGAFEKREFADAVGTTREWLKKFLAGKETLTPHQLKIWFRHLKPYYCPQPELQTVKRNVMYKWRLVPYND